MILFRVNDPKCTEKLPEDPFNVKTGSIKKG